MALTDQRCIPCEGGMMPLTIQEAETHMKELAGWKLSDGSKKLEKEYKFKDFAEALAFVNKAGAIAEAENHHPDIEFGWGKAEIELTTHSIGGLSVNDFILAAKIDQLK